MRNKIYKKIVEAKRHLDYTQEDFAKRKVIVETILTELQPYLELYFSGEVDTSIRSSSTERELGYYEDCEYANDKIRMFDVHPNCSTLDNMATGDHLSDQDFVCKFLEQLASYVLHEKHTNGESKQHDFEKTKVGTFTTLTSYGSKLRDDGEAQATRDIKNMDGCYREDEDTAGAFDGNFKKQIKQEIFKEDISRSTILKDYNDARIALGTYKRNNRLSFKKLHLINKTIAAMKDDMIYTKNQQFGTIYFRHVSADSGTSRSSLVLTDDMTYDKIDYQEKDLVCDFFDEKHYQTILKVLPFKGLSENVDSIINKFDMLSVYLKLSEDKSRMLQILRDGVYNRMEYLEYIRVPEQRKRALYENTKRAVTDITLLAEKLQWEYNKTKKVFDRLCYDCYKAFLEMYEEEFYYMYTVKGEYKKCYKCNEVKLVTRFNIDIKMADGRKSICKRCYTPN